MKPQMDTDRKPTSVLICVHLWFHFLRREIMDSIAEFNQFRSQMNNAIMESGHLGLKRFFALDHQAYEDGALPAKTKELMGLVASMVLRCDDCITYHILRCVEEKASKQ